MLENSDINLLAAKTGDLSLPLVLTLAEGRLSEIPLRRRLKILAEVLDQFIGDDLGRFAGRFKVTKPTDHSSDASLGGEG